MFTLSDIQPSSSTAVTHHTVHRQMNCSAFSNLPRRVVDRVEEYQLLEGIVELIGIDWHNDIDWHLAIRYKWYDDINWYLVILYKWYDYINWYLVIYVA